MRILKPRGGVHPKEVKELTENKNIEIMPDVKIYKVSLHQHIGVPACPVVSIGDYARVGQIIGESTAILSVDVHAPVSGYIKDIREEDGETFVIIENDFKNKWIDMIPFDDIGFLKEGNIFNFTMFIRSMGICGLGGAMFPTHMKFHTSEYEKIHTIIINGVECEPYLNADNRIMIEKTPELIEVLKALIDFMPIKKIIIAIEDNKSKAINKIKEFTSENSKIEVAVLKTIYPQGGEKQIIKSIMNIEIPQNKIPMEYGLVVINVGTLYALYEGIYKGKPLIERVVTVSGHGIKEPKNLMIKIGTPMKDILNYVGIDRENTYKLILGGPMMGKMIETEEITLKKGTSGILALLEDECNEYEIKPCINCGACVDVCPMGLMPLRYVELSAKKDYNRMEKRYSLSSCIKCGSCEYICPSKRPLIKSIFWGFKKLKEGKKGV
jgi:electron transport complex protein RnfC